MLLLSLEQPEFLVATCVLSSILALTHGLSVQLQTLGIDLTRMNSDVNVVITALEERRGQSDESFSDIWMQATELANLSETELTCPRFAVKQRNRNNVPADTPPDYYRRAVYIPCLDNIITDMKTRFSSHSNAAYCLTMLIPAFVCEYKFADLEPAFELYDAFLDVPSRVAGEFEIWKQRWSQSQEKPRNAIDALDVCNIVMFPNIAVLLQILATLPVTTATAEHSFSTLKRLKTYLRSSMCDERLTSLALIYVHADDVELSPNEVIDQFASSGHRKLMFLN